jgi:hypothetical protein
MGKRKYIETPEKMWELFEAYRKDVKDNPRFVFDYVGKDGTQVKKPLERPLTMEGFKCYVWDVEGFTVEQYFTNQDGAYTEYLGICSRIKETIRRDQIEGGMVGQYNPSITQRLNGLAEKTQNENLQKIEIFKGIDLSVKTNNSTE